MAFKEPPLCRNCTHFHRGLGTDRRYGSCRNPDIADQSVVDGSYYFPMAATARMGTCGPFGAKFKLQPPRMVRIKAAWLAFRVSLKYRQLYLVEARYHGLLEAWREEQDERS